MCVLGQAVVLVDRPISAPCTHHPLDKSMSPLGQSAERRLKTRTMDLHRPALLTHFMSDLGVHLVRLSGGGYVTSERPALTPQAL